MHGYTKLFGSIVASTVWSESKEVKIVWITMLAIANSRGIVEGSVPGLAVLARVTTDECTKALAALSAPDEYSRTKDHEGRRIAAVDGGWQVLNHAKYRAKMNADERRAYMRDKQREYRSVNLVSTNVNTGQQMLAPLTQSEAESEAESEADKKKKTKKRATRPPAPHFAETLAAFCVAWKARYSQDYHAQISDRANLSSFLRTLGEDQIAQLPALFAVYMRDADPFVSNRRHDLTWFCTTGNGLNKYRVQGGRISKEFRLEDQKP